MCMCTRMHVQTQNEFQYAHTMQYENNQSVIIYVMVIVYLDIQKLQLVLFHFVTIYIFPWFPATLWLALWPPYLARSAWQFEVAQNYNVYRNGLALLYSNCSLHRLVAFFIFITVFSGQCCELWQPMKMALVGIPVIFNYFFSDKSALFDGKKDRAPMVVLFLGIAIDLFSNLKCVHAKKIKMFGLKSVTRNKVSTLQTFHTYKAPWGVDTHTNFLTVKLT